MTLKKKPNKTYKICVIAGEPSGDLLGAKLADALREHAGASIEIIGIAGPKMAKKGIVSPIDIRPLSVFGIFDGIKAYPKIKSLIKKTVSYLNQSKPDLVVFIDSWGFTARVARAYRAINSNCIFVKYVGPQIFASRAKRAKTCAQIFDHLLSIHCFDVPLFEQEGLATSFVGNPALFAIKDGSKKRFLKKYGSNNQKILSVLFGSRRGEVPYLLPPFLGAIDILKKHHPDLLVVSPVSDALSTYIRAYAADEPRLQDVILLPESEKADAFAASDLALACSGTVTSELAARNIPMVVGYRLGPISSYIMKNFVFQARFANLINITGDKEIIPEFLGANCTARALANALETLLTDAKTRETQQREIRETIRAMRGGTTDPSHRAAKKILELLD